MYLIQHRVNTREALEKVPRQYGVEMDLHSYGDRLVVHHDPFVDAIDFDDWLDSYRHAFLILNIKEEGIEARVMESVKRRGIQDWFLLDVSAPFLYKIATAGEKRLAARVSCYESVETALALAGKVEWVFIDVIEKDTVFPLAAQDMARLKKAGFKLCMVSHDVWGRPESMIPPLKNHLHEHGYAMDAILTKHPKLWEIK